MTNEQAIKVIKRMIKTGIAYDDGYAFEPLAKDEEKACGMAIKALEEQEPKKGWIDMGDGEYKCPKCHKEFINGMDIENMTKFFPKCPNCGCRMEK